MSDWRNGLFKDESDKYYSSRADTMHTIESTIVELGGIFSQVKYILYASQSINQVNQKSTWAEQTVIFEEMFMNYELDLSIYNVYDHVNW